MASEFLKKLAEEQAKGIKETFGAGTYGSTAYIPSQPNKGTMATPPVPQPAREERRENIWQQAISAATPSSTEPEVSRQAQRRSYASPTTERTRENRRLYGMDTTLPEGRYSQITIPEATTKNRTLSELYNDATTMNRWRELASKDSLSAEEKKEARAARQEIERAMRVPLSEVKWNPSMTQEEYQQRTELGNLNNALEVRSSLGSSFMAGAVHALGLDWLSDRIRGLGGDEFEKMTGNAPSLREVTSTAQRTSPVAYSIGNIAASAAEMISVGGAVGNAMKGVEWFAKAPGWIQRALSSGITFGLSGLQSGVASTQTKEEWDEQERKNAALAAEYGQEYTPREYSVGRQLANVGISTATGALAGAAGGALETAFGIGTSRALIRNGLQYNTLFRAIASGINGVGFAAGSTAIQEASKYLQYPEGYTASASEIASNMAVAFLFSSVSSVLSDVKAAPQNRENLLKMMDDLTREYAEVEMKMAGMTGPARRETAQKVTELTARIRNSIATSRGMSGVSNEIKSLAAALDIIDDRMAPIIAGGNGLLGAGDIMAQAEAAGFNPNTTLRLPAWGGTPSQPTNLEQAVQIVGANVPAPMGETPAIPEATAPSENFPAWYTAYQNAPRPIDQPMQQRPNIPVPASRPATVPASPPVPQSTQGNAATPPAPPVPQRAAERPTEAPLTLPGDRGTMEPAKAETPPLPQQTAKAPAVEEAKRELKGTIRMPVQGKNVDALEQGASTGELTMDSVTIGAKVPGFTREQQTSLAEQIIEGVQSGQKEITAKVPNDGTFTVTNQPGAVAQVLNGLKVKANQDSIFTQKIDRWLRGAKKVYVASLNGEQYVTDGKLLYPVGEAGAEFAKKDPKGYMATDTNIEGSFTRTIIEAAKTGNTLTQQPYTGQHDRIGPVYIFDSDDGQLIFNKKLLDMIDAETFRYGIVRYLSGKTVPILVSVKGDGSIAGALVGYSNTGDPIDTTDATKFRTAKLKGIGDVAQSAGERAEEPENTPALNLPKEPEAPAKAEAPLKLPTEQKGENNGQVDVGRGNAERGSDAGRRGPEFPAKQPAEAKGLPRNGNRGEEQPGTGGEDAQGLRGNGAGRAGSDSGSVAGGDEGLSIPDDGGDAAGIRGKEPVKRPRNHNKRNYRLSQDIDSTRPSFRDNLAAIKLVKALQKEGRSPTPEEMDILAKYKGWGGLKTDVLGTGSGSYNAYQLRQVLTPEEYNDVKASVLNAHYTSTKVIDGIYSALTRMGFSGGNILEPSMGVGNFFGRLPEKFSKNSDLYGVELDSITGAIAQYLYPDAKIDVAGFQDVLYPDGTFDLVVGNVPFSNQIKIPYRGSSYNLHDFFFLKALDEMKPGGVAALITSTGTLDKINGKVQKEIADRANLIAAFRLPDDAFKTNAGTSVTTDLLFLQKKGDDILDNDVAFGSIGEINGIPINEYYVDHPKNILGKLAREKGMYVSDRTVVHAEDGFEQRFEAAMKSLPKDIMRLGSQPKSGLVIPKKKGQKTKTEFKVTSDGAVVQSDGKATPVNKKAEQTIKDYVQLKNTFNALIDAEKSGNVQGAEEYRRRLNEQYDSFTAKHGNLSDKNKKLLSTDDDFTKLSGLEIQTKDGISKSAIFTRPTISRAKRTSASSPQDALAASLNDTGKVDLPYMAKLTGRSVEDLAKDLEGDIVYTPDGDYVLTAQYVSGNIYEKLAALEGREGFEKQKKMLEAAIPRRKGPEEINASLGSHWIPTETYTEFLREVFGLDRSSGEVSFDPLLGKWYFPSFGTAVSKYDAPGVATPDLVNQTLNGKNITIYVKDKDGKRHLDTQATTVAQAKQDQLRQDFENWVFADKKRAEMLSDKFNRTMNAYAPMDYAELAKMLDTGISEDAPKQPRDYQKTAVARVVFGGNTLLHHGVGTGKTITMIVSAHVMKHNGIIHKPMFVVPNGKVNDFRTEILDLYPDASVLALDNDSMTPAQIKRTKAQIATGDWDYVIIYHSAFERLGITPETQKSFIEEQIAEYEEALRASREESGQRSDTRFEKNLVAKLKNLEEKLKDLSDQKRDDSTYFEDMGIDALFVDEAHNFKKVGFPTTFQISGIESGTNGKTTDLYMKENWLRRQGGRIILGTATPITNTLSEMYNMALHVNPDVYRDVGIYNFDTWLNTFADISAKPEIGPDGKTWRIKERVRGFKNGNEMVSLYRQFADVIQTKDVVKGLPKAKYVTVVSEGTDLHQKLLDWFATRSGNPQGTDNMLLITSDGRAAGTDLRLLRNIIHEVDPTATEEMLDLAGSKLNKCVDRVLDEYHKSSSRRGTQLIFLDLGIKAKEGRYGGISLYDDLIDKLVKNGIPREEIANIQDYDGEEKRTELYDDMNSGKKRILIGSTAKMGEGVNAQKKIVAIHQLSVPYRADNLEQQEGRAIRFGNENDEVRIYRYIQEKSYDSYMWQMIERKAAYMSQALAGGDATELEEVGDIELSARESKAIATGNPLIVEKMELQDKAEKLRILQKNFYTEQALARKKAEQYPEIIKKYENEIKDIDEDIQTVEKSGKDFSITLGKTTYTERKEAAEALGKILKPANYGKTIGKIHGMDILYHPGSNRTFDSPDSLEVRGKHSYTNEVGESTIGNITRILNLAEDAPGREKKMLQGLIESGNKQIEDAKKVLAGKFERQEELDKVTARQREVDLALGIIENEGQVEAESAGEIDDEVSNMVDSARKLYSAKHDFSNPVPADEFAKLIEEENNPENYFPKGLSKAFMQAIARKSTFTRPKLYRGIDSREFDFLAENKFLKSNSSYNFSDQQGQTLSDESARYALSYATGFAPKEIADLHYKDGLPTYLIEFINAPDLNVKKNNVQESYTYDVIDQDYITRIFEITFDPETGKDMVQDVTNSKTIKSMFPNLGKAISGMAHGVPALYRDKTTGTILYAVQGPDGYETGDYISEKDPSMMFNYDRLKDPTFSKHAPEMLGISGKESDLELWTPDESPQNFNGNTAPKHPENWKAERVGDKDKTPISLTDIVNMIRHDFDIPVTTGNIRSPEARAQYRRQPQSIRSKIANSIPDIAHELGHHLDNIYDIRENISEAAKQEIIDAMPESFKAAYKKEQLPGEGVAEFLRRYLQNSETAVMDYPKFSDELFKMLDSKARATLDKLADEVNAYYTLSEQTGNWPVHNREDKGRDYRGLGEKLKDMNTHFRTLFIDSLEPIKQFDDESGGNAYLFATNAAYAGNRAYAAITGDLYDLRGNKLGVGLQKALEGIRLNNKKEYTDFGMYLICRHGPERLAEGMRVFADDAWDNTAWMEQTAEELADKYPNFEEAAERLEEYQHELIEAYGVASGLYSQETIDAWMERWEHYVPFLRWFGETEKRPKGQKQGFANQTRIHGKAVGSGLEIVNPVDNIMENTVRLITTSIRNEVMQEITKAAAKMEGAGRWLEQVPMPLARKTWDGKGLKSKTLDEFDEYFKGKGKDLRKNALDLIQQILDNAIDDLLVQYGRGKAHGDIVTVMKNGKPEYWKVNDPDLLRSVTTMGPTRAGELLNYYGRVTRFITGNITGMNIVWSIASNMPRDIGTMFTFSRTKNIVKLLSGIGESYVNRFKGDKANELYKEFMVMGGSSTSAQTADKDMAKKARKALQKQKTDWLNPLEWVEFVSDMIEAGPRYSYYKICRTKYGMTPEEAFYAAMEITVNFKKAGVLSREVNILVPFFNASIQGIDRAGRWLAAEDLPKEERKAGRTRRIGVYLGASLAIAALSMALNLHTKRKRDNLEKLSTYTKNNYFIVPMKNGKYVAIPKPRELAIPISLFERIMETYIGQNPHAFDDFWEYATDNTLPGVISSLAQGDLNSAIGDFGVLGTFHYLTSNQDFLGRPIVSDSLKKLEAKDQYDQNTSQLAKLIGQVFNASPKQMDFLGNNLFGGFWQWQKALAPVSGKADLTLGVQSKWIKDPLFSTDITNRMYDRRDKLEKIKNSNPEDIDAAAEYRTTSDLATFYGRYYRLAKNEEETPQSRVIREAMLDIILGVEQNAEVEPARKFLLDVVEQTGSTALMPTVMEVTVKSDGGTTYNLTAEEYFMHQTRYEALYYNYIRQATDNRPKMSDEEKVSTVEAAKKIAGIVARGEVVEDHGGTYKAYTKVKDLLEDGVSEGELINYLSAKDNADLDENGKVSNAELLHAAGALRIPANKAASLIDYSSSGNLGLKLRAVGDYGVDAEEYAKVLDALGEQTLSQENVVAAIDEVYGRTTTANRKEKAAMWQAMNKSWKAKNNPYDSEVGNKVSSGLKIPG